VWRSPVVARSEPPARRVSIRVYFWENLATSHHIPVSTAVIGGSDDDDDDDGDGEFSLRSARSNDVCDQSQSKDD
jgi:hypothetical protein